MESKLKGWRCKTLSWVGRNTLIKSVAQPLPYYTFSSFDVPSKVYDKLDATMRRFLWNPKKVSGNYLAWKSWEHICLPKAWGGLGFRKAQKSTEAFLTKLTWMVISNRKSLCMDALRSKYKVRSDWLGKDLVKSASQTWKAIERLKSLVASGACFLVGDGATIDIWKDPWVPWLPCFLPKPRIESDKESLVVACLINQTSRSWNLPKLMELFNDDSVEAIKKIRIPVIPHPDKLVWIPNPKGNFSVHSVYKVHTSAQSSTNQEI